ncbi:MAG: hypothetical protein EOP06_08815 [Proteobacteria bacterium]|nr:MAG: hypothetical protein EOP06_08815 [Pseudomonadota bacterium]
MLLAWARGKKGRSHLGYEDEIVSSVFGPLRYMQTGTRVEIVRRILSHSFPEIQLAAVFTGCSIEFWPNLVSRGRIEPDISIVLTSQPPIDPILLLVEAKWNSPQHDGQLHDQWKAAKKRYPGYESFHIYLTKRPHSIEQMTNTDVHGGRLASLTWSALVSMLKGFSSDDQAQNWIVDVKDFLAALGETSFDGFTSAPSTSPFIDAGIFPRWAFQPLLMRLADSSSYMQWIEMSKKENWTFDGDFREHHEN